MLRAVHSSERETLTPHEHEGMTAALDEAAYHHESIQTHIESTGSGDWANNPGVAGAVIVHYESLLRNKRLLLAYVLERMQKVKGFRWRLGNALPQNVQGRMAPEEVAFAAKYNQLLSDYMSGAGTSDGLGQIDLTLDATLPPKEPYITVLVKEDCGEVVTEDGKSVQLIPNSRHFLRRCDAEPLIQQGVLQHVPGA